MPAVHSFLSSNLQPHSPIVIRGNLGFTPANGVTAGSGISTDPYVIRGWDINASLVNEITVANTAAYFTIDSVRVQDGIRGIFLTNVTHGLIQNSDIEWNQIGVLLESSPNNTISNNFVSHDTQAIVANNSKGITILDNTVSFLNNVDKAILLNSAPDSVVTGNVVTMNGGWGICVINSPNVQVSRNTASSNLQTGIYMEQSPGATVSNNNITRNASGMAIFGCANATVSSNQVSWNSGGLYLLLDLSQGNDTVSNNSFTFNTVGISLSAFGRDVTIQSNRFVYDGIDFYSQPSPAIHSFTIVNNTVNDKPLLFYDGCSNMVFNSVAVGQLIAVNCRNLQITNLQITNTDAGLQLYNVNETTIMDNSINSNAEAGLRLLGNNITITFNNISNNLWNDAIVQSYQHLLVHHNNFIDDSAQGGGGAWDNGYPSGGNFWSDYVGVDNCSGPSQNMCPSPDGMGDTPYTLIGSRAADNYPLIKPYLPNPDTIPPTWLPESALIASNSSSNGVTLSWTVAADDVAISYYQIYEGSKIISTVPATLFKPSILLSHYVSGLTPGTVYMFKVEAVDWAGNPSTSGPTITVTTMSNGTGVSAWWIQYWYLFAIAGVAVGSVTAAVVFRRRTRGKGVAEWPQASTSI
jgi:parallel beta-helix repeat protein